MHSVLYALGTAAEPRNPPPRTARTPSPRTTARAEPPPADGVSVSLLRFPLTREESVRAKLAALRRIVNEDRLNPRIRGLAAAIFRDAGLWDPADHLGRARAILRWVQQNVIYVHEPVETFTRPRRLLLHGKSWRFGDCDEFTSTLCALYESVAFRTQMVGLGWDGRYRHVFGEVGLPAGGGPVRVWLPFEGTKAVPLGWSPVQAVRRRLTHSPASEVF